MSIAGAIGAGAGAAGKAVSKPQQASPFQAVAQAVAQGAQHAAVSAPSAASAIGAGLQGASAVANSPVSAAAQAAAAQAQATNEAQAVRAQATLGQVLRGLYQGADSLFRLPLDRVGNGAASGVDRLLQQLVVRSIFNRDFTQLQKQGLLPPGAQEPQVFFPQSTPGNRSYAGGGSVYLSPLTVQAAVNPKDPSYAWAQNGLIHELAHTMQTPQVLSNFPVREGGAQAYSDQAIPRVVGPLPINDNNYSGYVQGVRSKQGVPFITRGQFK